LDLPEKPTDREIQVAYRKKALEIHPDKIKEKRAKENVVATAAELAQENENFSNLKIGRDLLIDLTKAERASAPGPEARTYAPQVWAHKVWEPSQQQQSNEEWSEIQEYLRRLNELREAKAKAAEAKRNAAYEFMRANVAAKEANMEEHSREESFSHVGKDWQNEEVRTKTVAPNPPGPRSDRLRTEPGAAEEKSSARAQRQQSRQNHATEARAAKTETIL
jgi:hypothetical protein